MVIKRKDFLDAIPRNRKTMRTLYTHAVKMSERLDPTKKLIDGILRNLGCRGNEDDEEDEEEEDLCAEVEDSLLTVCLVTSWMDDHNNCVGDCLCYFRAFYLPKHSCKMCVRTCRYPFKNYAYIHIGINIHIRTSLQTF